MKHGEGESIPIAVLVEPDAQVTDAARLCNALGVSVQEVHAVHSVEARGGPSETHRPRATSDLPAQKPLGIEVAGG
jgi:hypothetical protein